MAGNQVRIGLTCKSEERSTDFCKNLDDALACFGTGFEEEQTGLLCICMGFFARDLPQTLRLSTGSGCLSGCSCGVVSFVVVVGVWRRRGGGGRINKINLVPSESDDDVGVGLALELLDPRLGLFQTGCFGDVVDNYSCLGVPVVHRLALDKILRRGRRGKTHCKGMETLLTGCVPNLISQDAVFETTLLCEECSTNGGLLVWLELIGDLQI